MSKPFKHDAVTQANPPHVTRLLTGSRRSGRHLRPGTIFSALAANLSCSRIPPSEQPEGSDTTRECNIPSYQSMYCNRKEYYIRLGPRLPKKLNWTCWVDWQGEKNLPWLTGAQNLRIKWYEYVWITLISCIFRIILCRHCRWGFPRWAH